MEAIRYVRVGRAEWASTHPARAPVLLGAPHLVGHAGATAHQLEAGLDRRSRADDEEAGDDEYTRPLALRTPPEVTKRGAPFGPRSHAGCCSTHPVTE